MILLVAVEAASLFANSRIVEGEIHTASYLHEQKSVRSTVTGTNVCIACSYKHSVYTIACFACTFRKCHVTI